MAQAKRIGWIDLIRALGACAIVLLHVTVSTFQVVDIDPVRKNTYILGGIVLCRWAVPAFFMVSGYLLLDPSRPFGWQRAWTHARRMLLVLATFGLAFSCLEEAAYYLSEGMRITGQLLIDAAVDVLTGHTWDHLWYVYALMFVYLLMPLLEHLRSRFGERGLTVLMWVLFSGVLVVPTMLDIGATAQVLSWPGQLGGWRNEIWWSTLIGLVNVLVGNYLRTASRTRLIAALGVGALAAMLALSSWSLASGWGSMNFVYMHESFLPTLYAAGLIVVVRHLRGDETLPERSLAQVLAQDSFGIYVLHPLFVHVVLMAIDPLAWPLVVYECAFFVVVTAVSVVATRVLRHVPFVGRLL